jgi:hypothetical protein
MMIDSEVLTVQLRMRVKESVMMKKIITVKIRKKNPGFTGGLIVFSDFERGFIAARSSFDWSQQGFIVGGGLRTEHGFISGFLRYL